MHMESCSFKNGAARPRMHLDELQSSFCVLSLLMWQEGSDTEPLLLGQQDNNQMAD